MQLSSSLLTAVAIFTSCVTASPIEARQATLQDWQVTGVYARTPSGRPGNYPWASITANITNPNEYNLGNSSYDGKPVIVSGGSQGLDCQAEWLTETPLGRAWPCESSSYEDGYWYMRVLEGDGGDFGASNFKLEFTHRINKLVTGQQFSETIRGEQLFKVGMNMLGSCGGSGTCNWSLNLESKPQLITPIKV